MEGKRIDGKHIAEKLLEKLQKEIHSYKLRPHMMVIVVGNDHSSQSYIRQKKNTAERIGAECTVVQFPENVSEKECKSLINKANRQHDIHGIIIQRPIPTNASMLSPLLETVELSKDIDGFLPNSPYEVPVARAILTLLEHIFHRYAFQSGKDVTSWLRSQNVVVLGKGTTAGKPIRTILESLGIPIIGIDQSTRHPYTITKKADVIISCVGKEYTVKREHIKNGVILLSVGLTSGEDGKMHGDYNEADIQEASLCYTPTPGGVGPVNVACLMQNLVKASMISL